MKPTKLLLMALCAGPGFGASCESLASLVLADTTISSAESVAAGAFVPPGAAGKGNPSPAFANLPAFCRVAATIKPTSDSDIKMEVWLPVTGWNGKYQAVGNGGWAGTISYSQMAQALRRGYAVSSTDTGHTGGGDGSFALGHPEKLADFAWRSVHEMTLKSKSFVTAFYGSSARYSYWTGCSTGGRQGLKEAQRFADDFDGIVAGAPANYWTHLMAGLLWAGQATLKDPAGYIPPAKYPVIQKAALEACDAHDGVRDGVMQDPTRCRFDPKILACKTGDGPECLTGPQVEAARKIYSGAKNPRTGQAVFPGFERGSELGWATAAAGPKPFQIADGHFKYVVFMNPNWDFRSLDFDKDVALADKLDNGLVNATDPDLRRFVARGGKLIQYHGWNDPEISPRNSANYYRSVVGSMGTAKVRDSYRLYMVPGMAHCQGGQGTDRFDMLSAIEGWVEQGKAPDRIEAARVRAGKTDRTRPLCPYPQVAGYKGSGSTDDAANFTCKMP